MKASIAKRILPRLSPIGDLLDKKRRSRVYRELARARFEDYFFLYLRHIRKYKRRP